MYGCAHQKEELKITHRVSYTHKKAIEKGGEGVRERRSLYVQAKSRHDNF